MTSFHQTLLRRDFLKSAAFGAAGFALAPNLAECREEIAPDFSFFVVGDTHYLANREQPSKIDTASSDVCGRLIDVLNRLPGETIPAEAGGGRVLKASGVIHAGDVIDTGDKQGPVQAEMQKTELARFQDDYGLTGQDGRLKYPVFEIAGNHDAPHGTGPFLDTLRRRNRSRTSVKLVSDNGVHYSWDWNGTHFVNLGLIVGTDATVARKRRYAALDSLTFLVTDLRQHVGESGRPVVLTHHVDVARYTGPCDPLAPADSREWDTCDVAAFHTVIKPYNVVGIFYGHTHGRAVFRWDGQSTKASSGIAVFNTDNASHFHSETQAFFYVESRAGQLLVREYQTKDRWQSGFWTPMNWRSGRS